MIVLQRGIPPSQNGREPEFLKHSRTAFATFSSSALSQKLKTNGQLLRKDAAPGRDRAVHRAAEDAGSFGRVSTVAAKVPDRDGDEGPDTGGAEAGAVGPVNLRRISGRWEFQDER